MPKKLLILILALLVFGVIGDQITTRVCFSSDLSVRVTEEVEDPYPHTREYTVIPYEQSHVIHPESFNSWLILDTVLIGLAMLSVCILGRFSSKYKMVQIGGYGYTFIILAFTTIKILSTFGNLTYLT